MREDPGQGDVDPQKAQDRRHQCPRQELAFIRDLTGHGPFDAEILGNPWRNLLFQRALDLRGAGGVILGQFARHRDQPQPVLAPDGGKAGQAFDRDDIGQGHIKPVARADLGAVQKVGGQFLCRQLHPDRGLTRPVGEGRRLDPAQPFAQGAAQRGGVKAQRLPLRGQRQDQFFLVIGQAVLQPRHLGIGGQFRLQRLGGGLQRPGLASVQFHRQRIPARAKARAAKAQLLQQGMRHDLGLQRGQEIAGRIGAQVRADQLHRDRPQKIRPLGIGPRQAAARRAPDLGQHEGCRVLAVVRREARRHHIRRALQFAHHRQRVVATCPRQHRIGPGDTGLFRRVEEAELHLAAHEQRHLPGQRQHAGRQHRIARPDHQPQPRPDRHPPQPVQPPVGLARRPVVPLALIPRGHRMGQMVRQDEETLDQRHQQDEADRDRDIGDQLAEPAADHHQPQKRDDRGDRRRQDRPRHPARRAFRRHLAAFA